MEERFAKIISYLFHPLFIPVCMLALILQMETLSVFIIPANAKWLIMGMVVTSSVILPVLIITLFLRKGLIRSLQMETREERMYPYMLMMLVYYVMYLLFTSIKLPVIASAMFLGVALVILAAVIINFWWKISVHTTAMGGMTGAFIAIARIYELNLLSLILVSVLLSGVVGFARLKLNAHKPSQVYLGYLVGMSVMMLVYFLK